MGGTGLTLGLICAAFIKNPIIPKQEDVVIPQPKEIIDSSPKKTESEGSVVKKFIDAISDLWKNPTARWVTIGGSFRFFEAFTVVYFLPSFYQKCYPLLKSEYGVLNGLIQSICGFISTIGCGILADKLSRKNKKASSWIGIIGGLIAIPAMAGAVLFKGTNFYLSMAFLAIKFLFSEGYMAPTLTMM